RLCRQSADHAAVAEDAAERFLIAKAILERDGDSAVAEQMPDAARSRLGGECLALEQHDIGTADVARITGHPDWDCAIAADTDDANAAGPDRFDVLSPGIEEGYVETALGEETPEQAAHCAGTDHDNSRPFERHPPSLNRSLVRR